MNILVVGGIFVIGPWRKCERRFSARCNINVMRYVLLSVTAALLYVDIVTRDCGPPLKSGDIDLCASGRVLWSSLLK